MIPHTQIAKASDFLLMLETASAQLSQRCSSWLEWPSISYRQSELPRLRSHFPCKNLISLFLSSARVLGLVGVMSFYQELCESFMSLEPLMHRMSNHTPPLLTPRPISPYFADGTVIYFLSFIMNERYKHLGMLELVTFVGCSNGDFFVTWPFITCIFWPQQKPLPSQQAYGSFCHCLGSTHLWIWFTRTILMYSEFKGTS